MRPLLRHPNSGKYLPNQSDSCLKFSQAFCASPCWIHIFYLMFALERTTVSACVALFIFTVSCQLFLLAGIILCTHLYANCQAHATGRSRQWAEKRGLMAFINCGIRVMGVGVCVCVVSWIRECVGAVLLCVCFVGASKLACHCRLICLLGFCLSCATAVGTQILRRVN